MMNLLCIKYQHILLKRETTTTPMTNIYTDDGSIPTHARPRSLVTSPLLPLHLLSPLRTIYLLHIPSRVVNTTVDSREAVGSIHGIHQSSHQSNANILRWKEKFYFWRAKILTAQFCNTSAYLLMLFHNNALKIVQFGRTIKHNKIFVVLRN